MSSGMMTANLCGAILYLRCNLKREEYHKIMEYAPSTNIAITPATVRHTLQHLPATDRTKPAMLAFDRCGVVGAGASFSQKDTGLGSDWKRKRRNRGNEEEKKHRGEKMKWVTPRPPTRPRKMPSQWSWASSGVSYANVLWPCVLLVSFVFRWCRPPA
jgi:hypothetical protein